MTTPPDAVTFDFWNTLVAEGSGVPERRVAEWVEVLGRGGHEVDPGAMLTHSEAVVADRVRRWVAGSHYAAPEATDALLARLGLVEVISVALRDELVDAFADPSAGQHVPPLTDGVAGALATLDDAGVRIGIICDVGFTPAPVLRRHLDHHGVLGHFDHWSFSDEVGVFKPDPVIFAHALDGLGVPDPSRAAHVGDLRRTDVAGSRAAGMRSVRYTGAFDDPGDLAAGTDEVEADIVVADHRQLPAALGLA